MEKTPREILTDLRRGKKKKRKARFRGGKEFVDAQPAGEMVRGAEKGRSDGFAPDSVKGKGRVATFANAAKAGRERSWARTLHFFGDGEGKNLSWPQAPGRKDRIRRIFFSRKKRRGEGGGGG